MKKFERKSLTNVLLFSSVKQSTRLAFKHGVDWNKLPRFLLENLVSACLLPVHLMERHLLHETVNRVRDPEPLFILGHWRSGTTYLHNLLSLDERFAYCSNFQAIVPRGMMLLDRVRDFFQFFLSPTRTIDNVPLSPVSPQEEEFALARMGKESYYHSFNFPQVSGEFFDRYVLLKGIGAEEIAALETNYRLLVKKLAFQAMKSHVLLKNPVNTARLLFLRKVFPRAKFVCIHRNPYELYESTLNLHRKLRASSSFSNYSEEVLKADVLRQYKLMMEAFFKQKEHIPAHQLIEVRYEDLVRHPQSQVEKIYSHFSLDLNPNFTVALENYLDSIRSYQKNSFSISQETLGLIRQEWGDWIQRLGYGDAC